MQEDLYDLSPRIVLKCGFYCSRWYFNEDYIAARIQLQSRVKYSAFGILFLSRPKVLRSQSFPKGKWKFLCYVSSSYCKWLSKQQNNKQLSKYLKFQVTADITTNLLHAFSYKKRCLTFLNFFQNFDVFCFLLFPLETVIS